MAVAFILGLAHVVFYQNGFMNEWDYWAGTFGLVALATIEVFIFVYIFGLDRGWDWMHRGADLQVPEIYKPVMKYVTPAFLAVILLWWGGTQAIEVLLMQDVANPENLPYRWASRITILGIAGGATYLIKKAWDRRRA